MGNLPAARLQPAFPFSVCGLDYAGPVLIKDKRGRGARTSKCWIALFVCFVTKAIHIELVSSLTTESFIQALRRFVSRRGKPSDIYSDNATTFVGANKELQLLITFVQNNANEISTATSNLGIKWHFIPANSPNFGGLWEAGVKSVKYHLRRVVGDASLTFEDLYTVLLQIEAVLNSRPLFPLSSEPDDLTPLTPSHFLVGRPMLTVPDPDLRTIADNRLSQYQHIQLICQHFWTRWYKEYLHELQQRSKWKQSKGSVQVGQLVLIKDDNLPPIRWRLGRIVNLVPGLDGVHRVASIRTADGTLSRALSRLCPLPPVDFESPLLQGRGYVAATDPSRTSPIVVSEDEKREGRKEKSEKVLS